MKLLDPLRSVPLSNWKVEPCGYGVRVLGVVSSNSCFRDGASIRSSNIIAVCRNLCLCEDAALYALDGGFERIHDELRSMLPRRRRFDSRDIDPNSGLLLKLGIVDACESLRTYFKQDPFTKHFEVESVETPESAVDRVCANAWDAVVVRVVGDHSLGVSFLKMLAYIYRRVHLPIIVLESIRQWNVLRFGYPLRGEIDYGESTELVRSLKSIIGLSSPEVLPPNVVEPICLDPEAMISDLVSLSRREAEIVKLRSVGLSCKEVAERLAISTMTVYAHARNTSRRVRLFLSVARKGAGNIMPSVKPFCMSGFDSEN